MITIKLFYTTEGPSNILVNKMKKIIDDRGLKVNVAAFPESQIHMHIDSMDAALLEPQVGYRLSNAKELCATKSVPVEVIPMIDYGMMNVDKILESTLELLV